MANLYTLERAKWTTAKRKQYLKEHPENFAGPAGAFPIEDASDVGDAWGLAGHAENPDAVRAKIKSIAKRLGLESGLPDTATEDGPDKKERSTMGTTHTHEALIRAAANHDPFTGTHSHSHPAHDSQGDDDTHEHSHSHDNDNNHDHSHSEDRVVAPTTITPEGLSMYAPITRIDKKEWLIEGQATSDAIDSYGTIFDYESSKRAFLNWRGNIREMHTNKAVGHAVEIIPDDVNRCIFLRAMISKGEPATWEKILDGTLSGFSIGVNPAKVKQKTISRNGKSIPMYHDFDDGLSEVSVVDNPGSPNCNFALVRANGMTTELLSVEDEQEEVPTTPDPQPIERAGARLSADSRSALHDMRDKAMSLCGCDECTGMAPGEPDGDEDMSRSLQSMVERILEQKLSAVYARLQGIAGALARSNAAPTTSASMESIITGAITRAVEVASSANESSLAEVRASLSQQGKAMEAVKEQVDAIANTPVPGAPVLNAGAIPRPVEKRLATDPYAMPPSGGAVYDAVAAMSAAGRLDTTEKQIDAVAAALAAQRRR